jgi:hypothetical protein
MTRLEGPYHQSEINDYLSCPQALLLKLQGVEPAFRSMGRCRGRAVHTTVNRLHRDRNWDRWEEVFDEAWTSEFSLPGPPINADAARIEKEYQDWRTAVGNYVERERDSDVLCCELPVRGIVTSRSGREYAVEGTVDQVRPSADGDGYDVYELKTNATLPGPAGLGRNVQLSLYCWCCVTGEVRLDGKWAPAREVLPGFLRGCVLYKLSNLIPYKRAGRRGDGTKYSAGDLRGDPDIALPIRPDQLVEGVRALARIIAAIRAGGFFWNPSSLYGGCDACPYEHACGTTFRSGRETIPMPAALPKIA